ncbi:MAG: PAS domain S-box protein [Methylotenera sp.]|uniref:PAS domain-containing sensor histidine kinase n=4 Tax=Methylotenera sp. TaxID=2051956 RepID=UPI00272EFD65|nr:PAS domain S-box protein [Methylotenera sp.]MDP1522791.1 PAS domain S-box protein [Methylotenera sp.]
MTNRFKDLSFQALFDAVAEAMLLVDHSGQVVQANTAALQLLGYTQKDICGLKVEALMPQRYRDHHHQHREAYSSEPQKRPMGKGRELIALKRNGEEVAVDIGLSPLSSENQPYVLVTMHIAAQHRQVEEALRISEERLRLAKQAAGLGIFDFDSKHNVVHWDEKMCEIWGGKSNETTSYEDFVAAIHPEDRLVRQAVIERAMDPAGKGEYKAEYRVINAKDGVEHWVSTVGRIHFKDGHTNRLLGIAKDVTDQKILEQKLHGQRSEMDVLLNQQVASQTISAIAHELNQPLAAVSAYSEVALNALSGTSNPESLKRALEGCVAQAQRAGQSLHELISFLHKGELATEPFDLNDTVQNALILTQSYGYGGFYPILQLEQNMPNVLANKVQVQKVLVNLLRNAVEAMRGAGVPGAAITIRVQTNRDINMAHVTVADSGPGLNSEAAKRIFEPFFTTKPTGIGMGLSISRALAEANGGQLWIEPTTESGAIFHFTLPFAQ